MRGGHYRLKEKPVSRPAGLEERERENEIQNVRCEEECECMTFGIIRILVFYFDLNPYTTICQGHRLAE